MQQLLALGLGCCRIAPGRLGSETRFQNGTLARTVHDCSSMRAWNDLIRRDGICIGQVREHQAPRRDRAAVML